MTYSKKVFGCPALNTRYKEFTLQITRAISSCRKVFQNSHFCDSNQHSISANIVNLRCNPPISEFV